jgi:hypothetical protein
MVCVYGTKFQIKEDSSEKSNCGTGNLLFWSGIFASTDPYVDDWAISVSGGQGPRNPAWRPKASRISNKTKHIE